MSNENFNCLLLSSAVWNSVFWNWNCRGVAQDVGKIRNAIIHSRIPLHTLYNSMHHPLAGHLTFQFLLSLDIFVHTYVYDRR